MQSSIEVVISIFSFNSWSGTCCFAFCSSFLGSHMLVLNESFNKVARQINAPLIDDSLKTGIDSGVEGTPTFYINGVRYEDSWDLGTFSATVKRYLSTGV
jgi:thioredoxin family protein